MNTGSHVVGLCPACNSPSTLFLGQGGYVTCSWIHCPNPGAASDLLRQSRAATRLVSAAHEYVIEVTPAAAPRTEVSEPR